MNNDINKIKKEINFCIVMLLIEIVPIFLEILYYETTIYWRILYIVPIILLLYLKTKIEDNTYAKNKRLVIIILIFLILIFSSSLIEPLYNRINSPHITIGGYHRFICK